MFEDCSNTRKQGEIGVGRAIYSLLKIGCVISIPIADNQDYDLVAELDGSLKKIQVKTTRFKRNEAYVVSLATSGGNSSRTITKTFDQSSCDFLFILTESGSAYLIPREVVTQKRSISLTEEWSVYLID